MAISPVSLNQPMRPAEIDAINALNSTIAELNELDITGLNTRLTAIENNISSLQTDINTPTTGIKARMTAAESNLQADQTDITQIKATLYTNLDVV